MRPMQGTFLQFLLVLAPFVAVSDARQSAQPQGGAAGVVVEQFLARLAQGDVEGAARLDARASQDLENRKLPTIAVEKVWRSEIVPSVAREYGSQSMLAVLLVDAPTIKVIEVKEEEGTLDVDVSRVFLQLTYRNPESSPSEGRGLIRSAGLAAVVEKQRRGGTFRVRRFERVPEIDEAWTSPNMLAMCRTNPQDGLVFTCWATSAVSPARVWSVAESKSLEGKASGAFITFYLPCRECSSVQLNATWPSGETDSVSMPVIRGQIHAREPWLTQKWSGPRFSIFSSSAKLAYQRLVQELNSQELQFAPFARIGQPIGAAERNELVVDAAESERTRGAAGGAVHLADARSIIQMASEDYPQASRFEIQSRVFAGTVDSQWQKVLAVLRSSGEAMLSMDRQRGFIKTKEKTRGFMRVYSTLLISVTPEATGGTRVSVRVLAYGKDYERPGDRTARLDVSTAAAKQLLDDLGK